MLVVQNNSYVYQGSHHAELNNSYVY